MSVFFPSTISIPNGAYDDDDVSVVTFAENAYYKVEERDDGFNFEDRERSYADVAVIIEAAAALHLDVLRSTTNTRWESIIVYASHQQQEHNSKHPERSTSCDLSTACSSSSNLIPDVSVRLATSRLQKMAERSTRTTTTTWCRKPSLIKRRRSLQKIAAPATGATLLSMRQLGVLSRHSIKAAAGGSSFNFSSAQEQLDRKRRSCPPRLPQRCPSEGYGLM